MSTAFPSIRRWWVYQLFYAAFLLTVFGILWAMDRQPDIPSGLLFAFCLGNVNTIAIDLLRLRLCRQRLALAQLAALDQDIQDQTRLLQPLQAQMAMHESKLQQIPAFEQQIARLQQDYDALKAQYAGLREKEKTAEISHALEVHQKGEKFEVLDSAVTPLQPASPNRVLISLAGLFGGLFAGIALAAAAEMNDESVRSESEASRIFGKAVLSGIPQIVSAGEKRAWRLRAVGVVTATVAGAVTAGLLLSVVARGLF